MPFCLAVFQNEPTRKFMVQRFKNKLIYSVERICIRAEQIQSLSVRTIFFLRFEDHYELCGRLKSVEADSHA